MQDVVDKINTADNILVALSKTPTIDEMTAAMALTILLDNSGKHATAIYSGPVPASLTFLHPEQTFEGDTSSLQDFIVSLSKDKADHLRYKLEGDFVRVYITPYRTTITERDLMFSKGDYNVDLAVTFGVMTGEELDPALDEYGRILKDATAINISTGMPGRFAETEWNQPDVSSASEMVVNLAKELGIDQFDETIATILLAGIMVATERFSNEKATPATMSVASELMAAGANQQLISANLLAPAKGTGATTAKEAPAESAKATELEISHAAQPVAVPEAAPVEPAVAPEPVPVATVPAEQMAEPVSAPVVPEVVPGVAGAVQGGAEPMPVVAEPAPQPQNLNEVITPVVPSAPVVVPEPVPSVSVAEVPVEPETPVEPPKTPAEMMAEALAEPLPGQNRNPAAMAAPSVIASSPEAESVPLVQYTDAPAAMPSPVTAGPMQQGVTEPVPQQQPPMTVPELPPAPVPQIDFNSMMPPAESTAQVMPQPAVGPVPDATATAPVQPQPVAQPQPTAEPAQAPVDPAAFQIPGMG